MRSFLLVVLLFVSPAYRLLAQDGSGTAAGGTERSFPCSLAEGSCTNDFELNLLAADRRGTSRQWKIWVDTTVFYDAQERLVWPGILEWSVQVWNGRAWEPESKFISAPWGRENTTAVLVSKPTRVRVKVKLALGFRPPAMDVPVNALTIVDPES